MDTNAAPRPASTVLAVRDGDDGYEVLMVRRNLNSDFVGGAYVFPGGAVDPADGDVVRSRGLSDDEASATLGVTGGRAYYVAALRELFEEAGLLVARDDDGAPLGEDAERTAALLAARRALNAGETTFAELLVSAGLWLDLAGPRLSGALGDARGSAPAVRHEVLRGPRTRRPARGTR